MAWNLIRRNNGETIHTDYVEWMLDNAADISNGTEPGKSGSIGSLGVHRRVRRDVAEERAGRVGEAWRWDEWLTQARLV